jgi:hypothetical protein
VSKLNGNLDELHREGVTASPPPTDFAGRHNNDLLNSTARIIGSGQWKKQRVICVMPAGPMVSFKVMAALRGLISPPNQGFLFLGAEGMEVGEAYSAAIENILANKDLREWEYVLTVEHDNLPPNDGLLKLIKRMDEHPEFACIGGLYWTKGEGGVPQIWGDKKDPVPNYRPQPPVAGQLVECWGTGMGFNLFRMSMFRDWKGPKPFFQTKASSAGVGTQDLAFWGEAQKQGYRCAIDCDVLVGHLDVSTGIVW